PQAADSVRRRGRGDRRSRSVLGPGIRRRSVRREVVIGSMTDADYMARALFHASRGRGRTSPNPVVGAVIVSPEGVVVGQGYHEKAGEPHAEVNALDMAGPHARAGTLY